MSDANQPQTPVEDHVDGEIITCTAAAPPTAPAPLPADQLDEDGDPVASQIPPELLQRLLMQLGSGGNNSSSNSNSSAGAAPAPHDGLAAIAAGLGGRFADDEASPAAPAADEPARVDDGKDGLWRNHGAVAAHAVTKKNTRKIVCAHCRRSTILLPGAAELSAREAFLAYPRAASATEGEIYGDLFKVTGKMSFENIGVKQPVGQCNYRYLTCADCEWGPLGVTFAEDANKIFYVAHARVMYK